MDLMSATVSTISEAVTVVVETGMETVGSVLSADSHSQLVLIILGLCLSLYLLACLLYHLVRGGHTFLTPRLVGLWRRPRIKESYGAWALVTAATVVTRTHTWSDRLTESSLCRVLARSTP